MGRDLIRQLPDGSWTVGINTRIGEVHVVGDNGRLFHRRAIKGVGSGAANEVSMLVAELDGVKVYLRDGKLIVTRLEIWP